MKKFKSIFSFALALGMCVNSFLMVGAVGSDDESDSDGTSSTSSSTHAKVKAKEKKTQRKPVMFDSGETHREIVAPSPQRSSSLSAISPFPIEAEVAARPEETSTERKRRIIRNYLPNLAELQEIGFGVKIKNPDGTEVEQRVKPDVHFRGMDGKEYLVFYNNHIEKLREAIFERLKTEMEGQNWASKPMKYKLLANAQGCTDSHDTSLCSWFNHAAMFLLTPGYGVLELARVASIYATPEHSKQLAATCANLSHVKKTHGDEVSPDKLCAVAVDRELKQFISLRDTPDERYKVVEQGFYRIANSDMSDREMVIAMGTCLDEFQRRIKPRASDQQKIDFCFALNRVSYYLANLESDLQNKDLATLEAMDKLRKKANRLMLEYRFIFEQNATPILGVRIDRCKIIAQTENHTMIFLDREETKKFKRTLDTMLDNKATNITRTYSYDPFTGEELRRLAESLDPDSCQEVLDYMDHQIVDMKAEADKQEADYRAEMTKASLRVVENGAKIALAAYTGGASEVAQRAIASSSDATDQSQQLKAFAEKDIREYLAVEESLKASEKVEEVDPMQQIFGTTFDNPHNITVDQAPANPSPVPETRVDRTGFSHTPVIVRTRKENTTPLGQALKELNLRPEDIDGILKGFKSYIESKRIQGHMHIQQRRRDHIAAQQKYMTQFINMVKLYIRLVRGNFDHREDFEGVLIEELKDFEVRGGSELLREYIVREINRLEDLQ